MQVIGGNIALPPTAAKALADHGADAVKVGIGPGSICTTRIVAGVGVPQITAIAKFAKALAKTDVPPLPMAAFDFRDIAKAISAGAHCVMVGTCLRAPRNAGDTEFYQGRSKVLRKWSLRDEQGSADRYFQEAG